MHERERVRGCVCMYIYIYGKPLHNNQPQGMQDCTGRAFGVRDWRLQVESASNGFGFVSEWLQASDTSCWCHARSLPVFTSKPIHKVWFNQGGGHFPVPTPTTIYPGFRHVPIPKPTKKKPTKPMELKRLSRGASWFEKFAGVLGSSRVFAGGVPIKKLSHSFTAVFCTFPFLKPRKALVKSRFAAHGRRTLVLWLPERPVNCKRCPNQFQRHALEVPEVGHPMLKMSNGIAKQSLRISFVFASFSFQGSLI